MLTDKELKVKSTFKLCGSSIANKKGTLVIPIAIPIKKTKITEALLIKVTRSNKCVSLLTTHLRTKLYTDRAITALKQGIRIQEIPVKSTV